MSSGKFKVMSAPKDILTRRTAKRKAGSAQQAGPSQPSPEDPAEAYELQEVQHHGPGENGEGQGQNEQATNGHDETAEKGIDEGTPRDQQAQAEQNAAADKGGREQADDEVVIDDVEAPEERRLSPIYGYGGQRPVDCCLARCVTRKTFTDLMLLYCLFVVTVSQMITATNMCPEELNFFSETVLITTLTIISIVASVIALLCIGGYTVASRPYRKRIEQFTSALFILVGIVCVFITVHFCISAFDAFDLRSPRKDTKPQPSKD